MRDGSSPWSGSLSLGERVRVRGRPVVLYDGDCAFCRVCARLLRRLDSGDRLDLVDFNRSEADRLLELLPAAKRRTALHLADPDGMVHSAGPALRRALAEALGPHAGRILSSPLIAQVLDAAYSIIATQRHRLGWVECVSQRIDH